MTLNQTPIAHSWSDCGACDASQQEQDAEATVREATRAIRALNPAAIAARLEGR